MIAQAEALKFGIEHFRRRTPHCSGTLVWQLNDCWPVLSWALLDYHGFGKAGYYAVKRAFAPVLASFKVGEGVELWVTNDTGARRGDTARVRLGRFGGEVLARGGGRVLGRPAHAAAACGAGTPAARRAHPTATCRCARRPRSRPTATSSRRSRTSSASRRGSSTTFEAARRARLHVRLRADAYAYFVHLAHPDERVRFSDNYLELEPGEERTVELTHPDAAPRPQDVSVRAR